VLRGPAVMLGVVAAVYFCSALPYCTVSSCSLWIRLQPNHIRYSATAKRSSSPTERQKKSLLLIILLASL